MTTETDARSGGQDAPKPAGSAAEHVTQAREELAAALDAIQDRLNVRKRLQSVVEENPGRVAAVAGGALAAVAGAAWLAVRLLRR